MSTATLTAPVEITPIRKRKLRRPGDIERLRGVQRKTVKTWGEAGKVYREPDPSHDGYFLYDLNDVDRILASRIIIDAEPTDEVVYDRKRLLWIDRLLHDPWQSKYHVSPQSLIDWDKLDGAGCFALGGDKPGVLEIWFKGRPRPRLYAPIDFLDRYTKARQKEIRIRPGESPGPGKVWLDQAVEMGFPVEFLSRHSNYESPHRKRQLQKGPRSRPDPRPHPVLRRPGHNGFIRAGVANIDNVVVAPDGTRTIVGPPEVLARRNSPEVRRIRTGLSDLDEVILGLRRGSKTIVGGRPGMGKSVLLKQLGWNFVAAGVDPLRALRRLAPAVLR